MGVAEQVSFYRPFVQWLLFLNHFTSPVVHCFEPLRMEVVGLILLSPFAIDNTVPLFYFLAHIPHSAKLCLFFE